MYPETSEISGSILGDNCNIMRPKHSQCGRNASPETNVKSCGPGVQPVQRSKRSKNGPSQVNLLGEQACEKCKQYKVCGACPILDSNLEEQLQLPILQRFVHPGSLQDASDTAGPNRPATHRRDFGQSFFGPIQAVWTYGLAGWT